MIQLPPSMEKYRQLLEFQDEMRKICNERNKKYKLEKGREEKRRVVALLRATTTFGLE